MMPPGNPLRVKDARDGTTHHNNRSRVLFHARTDPPQPRERRIQCARRRLSKRTVATLSQSLLFDRATTGIPVTRTPVPGDLSVPCPKRRAKAIRHARVSRRTTCRQSERTTVFAGQPPMLNHFKLLPHDRYVTIRSHARSRPRGMLTRRRPLPAMGGGSASPKSGNGGGGPDTRNTCIRYLV